MCCYWCHKVYLNVLLLVSQGVPKYVMVCHCDTYQITTLNIFLYVADGLPLIINFLKNDKVEVREYASLAIANLTTANQKNGQIVVDKNGGDLLIKLINDKASNAIQCNASYSIANFSTSGKFFDFSSTFSG